MRSASSAVLAVLVVLTGVVVVANAACARSSAPPPPREENEASAPVSTPPAPPPQPIEMKEVAVPGDRTAWVLSGAREHRMRMVFLAGMCVHPLGYTQSFAHAAASRGDLLTLEGDLSCSADGTMRMWSSDLAAMSRRIDAAYRAAGLGDEARDVTLIGYSQGAERAERLVAAYPAKYRRAILIASPIVPDPQRLRTLEGAVLMAGERDLQEKMREGQRRLERAGIPATFVLIPEARHGQMGPTPDATMANAFDILERTSVGNER